MVYQRVRLGSLSFPDRWPNIGGCSSFENVQIGWRRRLPADDESLFWEAELEDIRKTEQRDVNERAEWVRPTLFRMDAADAENNPGAFVDQMNGPMANS